MINSSLRKEKKDENGKGKEKIFKQTNPKKKKKKKKKPIIWLSLLRQPSCLIRKIQGLCNLSPQWEPPHNLIFVLLGVSQDG